LKRILKHILYRMLILASLLLVQCGEKGEFNPTGPEIRMVIITELTATPNRVSVGGDSSVVSGRIVDQQEEPYSDMAVGFSATLGEISSTDTTDAYGFFSVPYVSGNQAGVDTITVSVQDQSAQLYITITGVSAELSLLVGRTSALANGTDTVHVVATLVGREGPVVRTGVRFETTAGTFNGQQIIYTNTDMDGDAAVLLTAPSSSVGLTALVTASVGDIDSAPARAPLPVLTLNGKQCNDNRISEANAEASTIITFRGVSISVEAYPEMIPGDGQSTAEIKAYVKEENLQAVPGAEVNFSAELGSIPVRAFCDEAGVATAYLTSAGQPGARDLVIARYGPVMADSVHIDYAEAVSSIHLTSEPAQMIADGIDSTRIVANVIGGTGEPAPGITVEFSSDLGDLDRNRAVTDENGRASVLLTGPGSVDDQWITVRGTVLSQEPAVAGTNGSTGEPTAAPVKGGPIRELKRSMNKPVRDGRERLLRGSPLKPPVVLADELEDSVAVLAKGVQVRLSVDQDSIIARIGTSAAVTAQVYETTSGNPVTFKGVRFSTTLGSIPGFAQLDEFGRAQVMLSAGVDTGRALIVMRFGAVHRDSIEVMLLPMIGTLNVAVDKNSLLAGGLEEALVSVQVTDALGGAAPGASVVYEIDYEGEERSIITDEEGRVDFVVVSPPVEEDSEVQVSISAGGLTRDVRIGLRAITRRITASPDSLSAGSSDPVDVLFQAIETTNHRPVSTDTVWFSGDGGLIQAIGLLDQNGFARTSFRAGDEPTRCTVVGQLGTLAPDTVTIELVEPLAEVELSVGRGSILADGIDTTSAVARVSNMLGDPTPGAFLLFEVDEGQIIPEVVRSNEEGLAFATLYSPPLRDDGHSAEIRVSIVPAELTAGLIDDDELTLSRSPLKQIGPRRDLLKSRQGSIQSRNIGKSLWPLDSPLTRSLSTHTPRRDQVVDSAVVELRGVSLDLRASPREIHADGHSQVGLNVHLYETGSGAAIPGAEVRFGASLGSVRLTGFTGEDGMLNDSLTAGLNPGISHITARYGDEITSTDSVRFTPDPSRLNIILTTDRDEVPADGETVVNLLARVVDDAGAPVSDVDVQFYADGAPTVLVDAGEHRNVTRWENIFRVDDPDAVQAVRLSFQLCGIDSRDTRISINRNEIGNINLPQDPLWRDIILDLPVDDLHGGANRISIIGGNDGNAVDRFSIAGMRLGLVGGHLLDEVTSDVDGRAEAVFTADLTADMMLLEAVLSENPDISRAQRVYHNPGDPAAIIISTDRDTLIANGLEESDLLAMVTDANGNPVGEGFRVDLSVDPVGDVEPAEAVTLADGTVSARFITPVVEDEDIVTTLSAACQDASSDLDLLLRAPVLRLILPDERMLADGVSRMTLSARLGTVDGAPIAGRRIEFSTTRGLITPVNQTNADGFAVAILTAGDTPDTATVTASFGPHIREEVNVIFAQLIESIDMSARPPSLPGSGLESTEITITAIDGLGEAAADVRINLAADQGQLSIDRVTTDNRGEAAVLLDGIASEEDDQITVIATLLQGDFSDTLIVPVRGVSVTVSAEADSLPGNGTSTTLVTARVAETTSGAPVDTGRVSFFTDLGGISGGAWLSEDGIAEASFTAPLDVGTAVIRAQFGAGLSDETGITIVHRASDMRLEITPASVPSNGKPMADVLVTVTDPWGDPAVRQRVEISFEGPGSVTPLVGLTDENGEFTASAGGEASADDGELSITAEAREGELSASGNLDLRGVAVEVDAEDALIPGDGESMTTITARVQETGTGHPVVGDTVRFTSSAGVIAAYVILDETGRAITSLRSDPRSAIAVVTASYGDELLDSTQVAFASRFSYLDAEPARPVLLADGVDTTLITAALTDTLGDPVEGVYVSFGLLGDEGEISADSAMTDRSGTASVTFTSSALEDDRSCDIRIFAGNLEDTLTLMMRGITLEVAVEPDSLPANGLAEAEVTASVRQTSSGNPVTGRTVSFAVDAGGIGEFADLSERGRASVTLTAPADPAQGTVTISFGRTLTADTPVVFVRTVESLELSAGGDRLLGDGLDTLAVTARALDEIGDPAPGVTVHFSAPDGGSVEPEQVSTNDEGLAVATYTGFAVRRDSTVTVEASTDGAAADQQTFTLLGVTTRISAVPNRLPANGRSSAIVSFGAYETTAHTPLIGHSVTFSADRGNIGHRAELDTSGTAVITFVAPIEPGDALITAIAGDTLQTSFILPCIESVPAHAELSIDPAAVSVAGVGRNQSATLTAYITDSDRQVVPDGNLITFRFTNDIDVRFAGGHDTVVVETENGAAAASVTAGEEVGTVRFEALYGGQLLATGGELLVLAGPPARISVHADVGTIHHPGGGLSSLPVSATVADRFSNPVEDSTVVRFYLEPDDIAQVTAVEYTENGVVATAADSIDYPNGVWVTYSNENAGEEIWVHATAGGGSAHDSTRVVLPGAVEGGEPAYMELGVAAASLEADGFSGTEIQARIYDADDQAVADMTEVTLTATLGSVQSPRQTADGEISSIYRAGRIAGVDTVRVTAGMVRDSLYITLRPGPPAAIELSVEDDEIRANGVQFTNVVAEVRDRFGNLVSPGTLVEFSSELGRIAAEALTDSSGRAAARLVAGFETGISLIGARSGAASAQTSIRFVSGEADGIVLNSIDREHIGVRGSGAPENATLIFEVRDDRGVAVDRDHAVDVHFTLDGPAKVIDPDESSADSVAYLEPEIFETDESGQVAVTLNAGYFAGAVEITAAIGDSIFGQAISVAIHGGPPDEEHFSLMTERCVLTGIYGTPVDTTSLWVNVGDRFSNPTVPGTVVRFSSTGGVIEGSGRTDSLGQCSVLLTSARPWPVQGVDTITAQTVGWNNEEITAQSVVLITGPTRVSFDTTNGFTIPFGAYRSFVVTVADTFGHPLVAGTTVLIEVEGRTPDGDAVEGIVLTGDAVEEEYELQECAQRSDFFVRIFNYVNGLNGADITLTATVTSPNGDVIASLDGAALGQVLSTSSSRVVLSPDEIIADGEDECDINVTLYDVGGIAIPDVPPDEIVFSIDAGNPLITPPEEPSDEEGRLTATVVGRALGVGTVEVRVGGQLLDDQPTLTFIAGPPERMLVNVLNRRLVVGGDTTTVIVDVSDGSGNPVPNGTTVVFQTVDGSFIPASTTTTDGRAVTLFFSGNNAGESGFTVTASYRGGVVEEEISNIVFLPGAPEMFTISAESYVLQVRSSLDLDVTCVDTFGNPVAENTAFTMSVSPRANGSVAPTVLQADVDGHAVVSFTAGSTAGDTAHVVATSGGTTGSSPVFLFTPGPPGRIQLAADTTRAEVGEDINLTATVADAFGNAVSDTTLVQFTLDPEGGALIPSASTTTNGVVTSVLRGVQRAGDVEVMAQTGDLTASVLVTFLVGELTRISVAVDPNLVQTGRSSEIVATAMDRFGNPVPGAVLNFTLTTNPGGNCTLQHNQRTTGQEGTARTIFTAGDTAGSAIITVSWDDDANVEGTTYIDIEEPDGGGG